MKRCQLAPRFVETYTPRSVPTYSRLRFTGSSRITWTNADPSFGRSEAIEWNVFAMSVDTYTYGVKSFSRWLSKATYTVFVSKLDGSMRLTHVLEGTPGK